LKSQKKGDGAAFSKGEAGAVPAFEDVTRNSMEPTRMMRQELK
jgi:hypothetical protein